MKRQSLKKLKSLIVERWDKKSERERLRKAGKTDKRFLRKRVRERV